MKEVERGENPGGPRGVAIGVMDVKRKEMAKILRFLKGKVHTVFTYLISLPYPVSHRETSAISMTSTYENSPR